jgi:1-acyl-sn-glycerol-3-phosphate acyltransferase
MKQFFAGDSYETSPDQRRYLSDRLFFWTRWSFYFRFIKIVLQSKALARKGLFDQEALADKAYSILKDIEGCGGHITIRGLDNLRKTNGPVVVVGNHMSSLEAVVVPCMIAPIKPVSFIVKKSLTTGTFFGPVISALDPITVTRKDARKDLEAVLTQGPEKLAAGRSLVIFPQSTVRARSLIFNPSKFNSLGVKLASRAGVSVIPLAIKTDFWRDGRILRGFGPIRRRQPIRFEFGEAIPVSGRGKEEQEQILGFIMSRLKEWGVGIKEKADSEK